MDMFIHAFDKFSGGLMRLLPSSPFQKYIAMFDDLPYLDYLNWFLPIKSFVVIGMSWLGVITVFYLYSVLLRWLKIIGD